MMALSVTVLFGFFRFWRNRINVGIGSLVGRGMGVVVLVKSQPSVESNVAACLEFSILSVQSRDHILVF